MKSENGNGLEHLQLLTEKVRLFEGLSLRELAWILRRATNRTFDAEHVLLSPSSADVRMFVILSGDVSIQAERRGKIEQIARLGPGASVGEMALIDREPRSATAIAKTETSVLEFDGDWLVGSPPLLGKKLYQNFAGILARRLRATNELFESFAVWPSAASELGERLVNLGLTGLDLSGIDATKARLERADLRGVDLRGANLSGADLRGAILEGTDLRETDLSRAKSPTVQNSDGTEGSTDPEYWQRVEDAVQVNVSPAESTKSRNRTETKTSPTD